MAAYASTDPRQKARLAGLLYLIVIAVGIFAEVFVRQRLTVAHNPAATAQNLLAHVQLLRWGFAAEMLGCMCNVVLALLFYELFRPAGKRLALLVVFFSLVGTAVESVSLLQHFAPLVLLGAGGGTAALPAGQGQALAYTSLQLFEVGFAVALVFFGCYCLALGALIIRSTFLPRSLGALLALGGLAYLINSFAVFLAPAITGWTTAGLGIPGIAETLLCLWLLIAGVDPEPWREQAAAAAVGQQF